jgi:acyl dehydratase
VFVVRHLTSQGRVLAALAGTVADAAGQRLRQERGSSSSLAPLPARALPGPEISDWVPAPPPGLVRDFIRHTGGDPAAWRGQLPPQLFPQWAVPLAARTLRGLPYPLLEVINAGCRLQINAPLPAAGPLLVRARLQAIDDDGRRAVLHQQIVTGTAALPDALVADLHVVVPSRPRAERRRSAKSNDSAGRANKTTARIPADARELAFWRLPADAGLTFALLTGDVNPIHWVPPYARAAGFPRPILHGFSTMARAIEGLIRARFAGSVERLRAIDVRFVRPLVLPARVGLYVCGQDLFVGDAPGGPAYLTGSFTERPS